MRFHGWEPWEDVQPAVTFECASRLQVAPSRKSQRSPAPGSRSLGVPPSVKSNFKHAMLCIAVVTARKIERK
jgi:hypothetical protein